MGATREVKTSDASLQGELAKAKGPAFGMHVRRKCACAGSGGGCPLCNGAANALSRSDATAVREVLRQSGRPLDKVTRTFMESRFGHEFGQVRVHADSTSARSAEALNARAYTVGRDIVFGRSEFRPDSFEGRRLLAHELAHVVQARNEGASGFTLSRAGDDSEQEADHAASAIMASPFTPALGAGPFTASTAPFMSRVALPPGAVARQATATASPAPRSKFRCVNANISGAGIPFYVIGLLSSLCGIGAGLASPAAAGPAALYCASAATGLSVGVLLHILQECARDPSVDLYGQNGASPAPQGPESDTALA